MDESSKPLVANLPLTMLDDEGQRLARKGIKNDSYAGAESSHEYVEYLRSIELPEGYEIPRLAELLEQKKFEILDAGAHENLAARQRDVGLLEAIVASLSPERNHRLDLEDFAEAYKDHFDGTLRLLA